MTVKLLVLTTIFESATLTDPMPVREVDMYVLRKLN